MIIRDNICKLCFKTYVVTIHLNGLNEMVQMSEGSQHMVLMRNKKNYHQILPLIQSSVYKSYKN